MTPEQFCYWLQGFFELTDRGRDGGPVMGIDHSQTKMIREHLDTVFNKVTPPLEKQKKVIAEKKKVKTIEEAIQEMQKPDLYCSTHPGRIC